MMTLLYVPAFAAETEKEQMQSTVLFQANQIDDPNMLMLRAELGVDERSEIVKQATNVFAETDLNKEQADLYTTTQLIRREKGRWHNRRGIRFGCSCQIDGNGIVFRSGNGEFCYRIRYG